MVGCPAGRMAEDASQPLERAASAALCRRGDARRGRAVQRRKTPGKRGGRRTSHRSPSTSEQTTGAQVLAPAQARRRHDPQREVPYESASPAPLSTTARRCVGIDVTAIPGGVLPGFHDSMDHTPPPPAHSRTSLAATLDRVEAALAKPDGAWLDRLASLGVWGAWLRWMLRLLAFEFALAGGEPCQLPGAEAHTGAARQLSARALDRRVDRLIKAAARLWDTDGQTSARPRRRRRRRLLQLVLRWRGSRHRCVWPAFVAMCRFKGAPVLALCKP